MGGLAKGSLFCLFSFCCLGEEGMDVMAEKHKRDSVILISLCN